MTAVRVENEAAVRRRFPEAQKAGEFPKDKNLEDFTRYVSMLLAGLSIQAANGASKAELRRTAQMAVAHLGY